MYLLTNTDAHHVSATWTEHHFTDDIQTRQYRCPEVILGAKWGTSADVWSVACVVSQYSLKPQSDPSYHLSVLLPSCLNCSRAETTSLIPRLGQDTARTMTTSPRSLS